MENLVCGEQGHETPSRNIVDLIDNHTDDKGWFRCSECGNAAYIPQEFDLVEGWPWHPHLWGAIRLNDDPTDTYQPYVYLVSDGPEQAPSKVWFRYYKDTRHLPGGRLYNRGAPVLDAQQVAETIKLLIKRDML